jgi:glutamine cyclotransferase
MCSVGNNFTQSVKIRDNQVLQTANQWSTVDGTLWSMTQGKHWAEIELSLDDTIYHASVGMFQDEYNFIWDNDRWNGDFDSLEKAKTACIQEIQKFINGDR